MVEEDQLMVELTMRNGAKSLQQNMCEFGEYSANSIPFEDFSKNCANGFGSLPFCNSRWRRGWRCDRSGSWTATLEKDMKIYNDATLEEILELSDQLMGVIYRLQKRRKELEKALEPKKAFVT